MNLYRINQINFEDGPRLYLETYRVVRNTPKGYWVERDTWVGLPIKPRWVSASAKKRLAYPTVEEARTSFLARKKRQIAILTHQLKNAQVAKLLAETQTFTTP